MILHLVTDEKFTDYAIKQFSAPEMESEFVLIPSNFAVGCVVKNADKCRIIKQGSAEFCELIEHLGDYSAIILHGMHWGGWETPVLKMVPAQVKVAWVFWGGDLYAREELKDTFKAPLSRFLSFVHRKKRAIDTSWQIQKDLFNRVDYILSDELEEYEFAKQYIGNEAVKFLPYNYYTLEETLGSCYDLQAKGENILLGNSASVENNFFEALLRLRCLSIENRKIIVPLSYGSPWIKNAVQKFGKWLFGSALCPLVDFMPRDEYNKLMLGCNTMVMNHWNPQAQGNMITGMWLGMRVYLSERSMTYTFFKRLGLKVYTVEHDLKRSNKNVFAQMTEEDVQHNRKIIRQYYDKEHTDEYVRDIVKELCTPKK